MIFEFKNLGTIKEAKIEMGNLTLICGKNNTGKTYLTYAVWGFLDRGFRNLADDESTKGVSHDEQFIPIDKQVFEQTITETKIFQLPLKDIRIQDVEKKMSENYQKSIHIIFNANKEFFSDTSIKVSNYPHEKTIEIGSLRVTLNNDIIEYSKREISLGNQKKDDDYKDDDYKSAIWLTMLLLFSRQGTFLNTAQRDSIQLFQKSLDEKNSDLLAALRETKDMRLLDSTARFAKPIEKNIDFARDLTYLIKDSFLKTKHPKLLREIEEILGVDFIVQRRAILIKHNESGAFIPDFMASTSVRSLMFLHFWLKHQAQEGDLLMIDEPELNLHPENQVKIARLFVKLVNVGIKVWITTHSDYIVKELNNLIMLGNVNNRTEILERYKGEYTENDILKAEDLRAYIAYNLPEGGATVKKVEVDKYGMVESTFDETINKMNEIAHDFAQNID